MPFADGAPHGLRTGEPFDVVVSKIVELEERANEAPGVRVDEDRIRPGQVLEPGGEVGGLADDRLLLSGSGAYQIANDHEPGG